MNRIVLAFAVVCGLVITWIDTRPDWRNAGITGGMLFAAAAICAVAAPRRVWIWALAVGAWLPLYWMVARHNFVSLVALVFAFAGAYVGMGLRRVIRPIKTPEA
jgi:hypothetical protein